MILVLLLIPLVGADNVTKFDITSMHISIDSGFDVIETDSDAKVEYIETFLELFPIDDERQTISNLKVTSNPKSKINTNGHEAVFRWADPYEREFYFDINADVVVKNKVSKIQSTINFPNSDSSYSEYSEATETIDINQDIRDQAASLAEGETDYYTVVFNMAEWVKSNVKYDLNTLTLSASKKSSWVMWSREGVCDEITNLFISMLRSLKIPAKFISGTVYSNIDGKWGNHGWAEVYFPGYGWVPFDVTLGQYGWVDSTHIKLQESADSSDSAIKYKWKSRNIQLDSHDLNIQTSLKNSNGDLIPLTILDSTFLKDEVDYGSYVPLEVTVANQNPYYVSTMVYISKAPTLIEDNSKQVLLKPNEIKNVYWIIKTPADLENNLIYTSKVEVKSFFGSSTTVNLTYSAGYDSYTLEQAENMIANLEKQENDKTYTKNIVFNCNFDKEGYYRYEDAVITCDIENKGNINFLDLDVCLKEDCKEIDLYISDKKQITYTLDLDEYRNEELMVFLTGDDVSKYSFLDLEILDLSSLEIVNVKILEEMEYDQDTRLKFSLFSQKLVKDIKMEVYPFGKYQMDELKGYENVELEFNSNKLDNGEDNIKITVEYVDENDQKYKDRVDITVIVNDVGFFSKMKNGIRKLFRRLI